MNANQEVDKALAHQASHWLTILRRKGTRQELAEFAEWLKTSPRHVRDFLLMAAIEKELHHVDPDRVYSANDLGDGLPGNVLALDADRERNAKPVAAARGPRRLRWVAAAAASLLVVVSALVLWQSGYLAAHRTYTTEVGEQRAVELADGSIAHLNTHSRIRVSMSSQGRDIELIAGEALFKVHRDPARPFRVHSQDAVIRAIGTQFNVYRRQGETTVSVLEGRIALAPEQTSTGKAPEELAAGEQARIAPNGNIQRHESPDLAKAVAWRQRRLVFDQDSLADMVREFNRYNKAPQFRLDGRAVETRHYTGVFDADDPESLVQLLSAEPDLTVTRDDQTITVRTR